MILALIDTVITKAEGGLTLPERYPGVDDDAPAIEKEQVERW
ncbi:hypothetical protein [Haloarcula argentinensis]|nr:hypothetical protein [Haloarcula argentinensis]